MLEVKTFSAKETADFAQKLGNILNSGDVVCLDGDLGAGKTAFTGGIAVALGITGYITSPTFTIVNEYNGSKNLYHFDVYRIADPEEMFEIGFDEYINGNGIVVIEWSDLIKDILPQERIEIRITKNLSEGADARIIRVHFIGGRYFGYENKLKENQERKQL